MKKTTSRIAIAFFSLNAAAAVADNDSVFHHYRKLIRLRQDHSVIVDGRFALLLPDDEQIYAFTRTLEDQRLVVVANFSSSLAEVDSSALPDLRRAELLLSTHPESDSWSLRPWESRIYLVRPGV